MPNRIIREGILDSKRINSLSEQAELFYRKLMSIVDDFGRYEADPSLLLCKLYAQRRDRTEEDLQGFIAECTSGAYPLMVVYQSGRKVYLEIADFNQRLRSKESRFPGPDGPTSDVCMPNGGHPRSSGSHSRARATTTTSNTTTPPTSNTTTPDDLDPEFIARETARKLHKAHPVLCSVSMAEAYACQEMAKYCGQDPVVIAAAWERSHAAHVVAWNEQKSRDPRAYIAHLHIWFRDEMYLQNQVTSSRASPAKGDDLREELAELRKGVRGGEKRLSA